MLPRNLLIIGLSALFSLMCFEKVQWNKYASTLSGVMAEVESRYVEKVDRRKLFEGAMEGMIKGLGDPYSSYISPEDKRQFEESLDQEFGGIGIVVEVNPKTKRLTVMNPLVGTPAHKAGLRSGDVIHEIDGHSTLNMSLVDAVRHMRGPPGTTVSLEIVSPGEDEPRRYEISRAIIPIDSVLGDLRNKDGSWNYLLESDPRIAYLRITTFGEHTVEETKKALASVDGRAEAMILDLRDNAGGLLSAAVGVCDLFLDQGRIVSTRGREGRILPESREFEAKPDLAVPKTLPIVVLVNHFSASASEIMAACLQDHHRAVVVGERTWGKGTVQTVLALEGGRSALKLTTASYWRPTLKNIHRRQDAKDDDDWGVRPDEGMHVKIEPAMAKKVALQRRHRDLFGNERRPAVGMVKKTPSPPVGDGEKPQAQVDQKPAPSNEPSNETPNATKNGAPASDTSADKSADESADENADENADDDLTDFDPSVLTPDPQLLKAIEHLQSKMPARP